MNLLPLTLENMETVRQWRHEIPETLRTPYMLTTEMQQDYYRGVICNRESRTRYWGLWVDEFYIDDRYHQDEGEAERMQDTFIGYGGIENIGWENGCGEISLLIGPEYQGKGYGREAVRLFLEQAFNVMRLHTIHGEVYYSSPAVEFWRKMEPNHITVLPRRKYYNGQYHHSMYFSFYKPGTENEKETAE